MNDDDALRAKLLGEKEWRTQIPSFFFTPSHMPLEDDDLDRLLTWHDERDEARRLLLRVIPLLDARLNRRDTAQAIVEFIYDMHRLPWAQERVRADLEA